MDGLQRFRKSIPVVAMAPTYYFSKNIPDKGEFAWRNGTKQGYRIWKFEPRLLPRHFLDIQIVLTVGDLYLFFDEAFVDLAVEGVDHTPPLYRMVDPA